MPYITSRASPLGHCGCRRCHTGRSARAALGERYLAPEGLGLVPAPGREARRARARVGYIKGRLAEKLMTRTQGAAFALREARAVAAREGIDPKTVRYTRNVKGIHHDGVPRQLTDGIIYGTTKDGKVRVLNVFESKARSSLRDIAVRRRGELGQLARDFERLRQLPVQIDGKEFPPSQVKVGRQSTVWTVFGPRDVTPTPGEQATVTEAGFRTRFQPLPLRNAELQARAEQFVRTHGVPLPRRR